MGSFAAARTLVAGIRNAVVREVGLGHVCLAEIPAAFKQLNSSGRWRPVAEPLCWHERGAAAPLLR
jgi:hypothetical protein